MISEGIDELMEVLSQYGPPTKALIPFRGTIQVNNKICPKDAKLLRNRIDFVPQSVSLNCIGRNIKIIEIDFVESPK